MKLAMKITLVVIVALALIAAGLVWVLRSVGGNAFGKSNRVLPGYFKRIDYSAPLEKKYAQLGFYRPEVHRIPSGDAQLGDYHIYIPTRPDGAEMHEFFPLVVMVNGAEMPAQSYAPVLEHLASWGFIVIANDDSQSGSGVSTTRTLKFALDQANTQGNPLYNKITDETIGIAGFAEGGVGTMNAVAEDSAFTSLYTVPVTQQADLEYDPSKITVPSFLTAGTTDDSSSSTYEQLLGNFEIMDSDQPVIIARRTGVDSKDMVTYGDPYMTAWFLWTLTDNSDAQGVFIGNSAEIRNNPSWQDIQHKNLP